MRASRHKEIATGRSVAVISAALIASFLTACTTSDGLSLGLAPQAQQPTLGYSDAGSSGSANPVAVEMSFTDSETDTVPYANTTADSTRQAKTAAGLGGGARDNNQRGTGSREFSRAFFQAAGQYGGGCSQSCRTKTGTPGPPVFLRPAPPAGGNRSCCWR